MKMPFNPNRAANVSAVERAFGPSVVFRAPSGADEFVLGKPLPASGVRVGLNPPPADGVSPENPSDGLAKGAAINAASDVSRRSADRAFLDARAEGRDRATFTGEDLPGDAA